MKYVTQFFENKEESIKRLEAALKGRPVYPGLKEREELLERGKKLREEIQAFKELNKIEDPSEHDSKKNKEVSQYLNEVCSHRWRRRKSYMLEMKSDDFEPAKATESHRK